MYFFSRSNKGKICGTKEEEEENEGLALLIPDIQETARIVHSSTERLREHDGMIPVFEYRRSKCLLVHACGVLFNQ